MIPFEIDFRLAGKQGAPDGEKIVSYCVAFIVTLKKAIAREFERYLKRRGDSR